MERNGLLVGLTHVCQISMSSSSIKISIKNFTNKLTNTQRIKCAFEKSANVVGVINELRASHVRLACEMKMQQGQGRQGQQEPTE